MGKKDDQINELYECVGELQAKVHALTALLVQVSAIVNRKVEVLGPLNDKRFYLLRTTAALHDWDAARMMIEADPSIVDAMNSLEETALHFLVVENRLEAVEFLAKHGSDVNGKSSGITPIVEAARLGLVEMIDLLVRLGAKVDAKKILKEAKSRDNKKAYQQVRAVLKSHNLLS